MLIRTVAAGNEPAISRPSANCADRYVEAIKIVMPITIWMLITTYHFNDLSNNNDNDVNDVNDDDSDDSDDG